MHTIVVVTIGAFLMYAFIRLFAASSDKTDRKLWGLAEVVSPISGALVPGKNYWATVKLGKTRRLYKLVLPVQYRPGGRLIVAADGVTFLRREGNMEIGNGLEDWAKERGFALAILYPEKSRYAGLLSGWNIPGGFVLHLPWRCNDLNYAGAVITSLREKLLPSDVVGIGFSAGVDLFAALAEKGDGPPLIDTIVSMCGTDLGRGEPRSGTRLLAFSGDEDSHLPWGGGVGLNLTTWMLIVLGNWGVLRSQPQKLVQLYCTANGVDYCHSNTGFERPYHTVRVWQQRDRAPVVVLVKMHKPYAGHSFHGRVAVNSVLAKGHGQAAPREVVDPIRLLYEFFPPRAQPHG